MAKAKRKRANGKAAKKRGASKMQRAFKRAIADRPRKKRKGGKAAERTTTHKKRTAWFKARAAWPHREPSMRELLKAKGHAAATIEALGPANQWQLVGPTDVGGRMTSVVCVPNKPGTIWAGAAGGGVWKSENSGKTWRALWHSQPTLNIGALAIDPANPMIVYCGTGEANLSADSYPGVGLFRSMDGGASWQILADAEATRIPTRIGCVAVDPFDSRHICLGGVSHTQGGSDGMFVSRDGGLTWSRSTFAAPGAHRCHAIVFHPTVPGTLFATIAERGTRNGIWRSTDGGNTWTQLTAGLPSTERMGRTSLAISPSTPSVMYALTSSLKESVLGVFRSNNGGNSWINVAGKHFADEDQMSYGNTIAIHPTDPNHVLCGGVDLHLTRTGGKTWRRVTRWDADREEDSDSYAHADHHCLLMPAAKPGLVYDMNDGGMDISLDGGETWENRSNGLAVGMFYDVDVAQSDGRIFGGGMQDNGTNITVSGKANDFNEITGGDGGWMIIDPTDPLHLYTTSQNMSVYRHRKGWRDVSPPATKAEAESVWMTFLEYDASDTRTVFAGGLRVWRTQDDGANWKAVSPVLDGSPITAVEIAQADTKMVFVGTENGGFYRSTDGGDKWSDDLASSVLPGFTITRILAKPTDARIVYVTIANSGASHVFRSNDGGATWTDIDRGRLPDVPHHAVVIPTANPSSLYVCNDAGVYVSTNDGASWKNLTNNLPTVPIVDLVYHDKNATLTAASYGRSLWRLKV